MKPSQLSAEQAGRIQAAAAFSTWLADHRRETSPALEAWLAAGPENRRVWARRQQTWDLFDQQAASPELLDLRRRALNEARRAGRRRWNAGQWKRRALAAGLAMLAVAGSALWYQSLPQTYLTVAGERRVLTLPDGSQVHLDAGTKLQVGYAAKARELVLLNGQARFDVVPDVMRPFSVLAAGRRVVATGTAFNVDLLGRELRVTLIEGRVVVLEEDAATNNTQPVVELRPGQQFRSAPAGQARIVEANPTRETAWQGGKLVFDDAPLAQVVRRVSRYTDRNVAVADSRTGDLRMSGVFATGDLDTFLTTVTGYLGVSARETDGGFLLTLGQ